MDNILIAVVIFTSSVTFLICVGYILRTYLICRNPNQLPEGG